MLLKENNIVNVLIADTQFLIVEALTSIIRDSSNYSLTGIVSDADELKKSLVKLSPEMLIIDVISINWDNTGELLQIKKQFPKLYIVVLTNALTKSDFAGLNKAGVKTILYKTLDKSELLQAMDMAMQGKKYFCAEVLDLMLDMQEKKHTPEEHTLTPSEIDIVRLIADGLTTKEIAEKKNISFHTVMTHRKNIFRKLEINNASELVMYAMRTGIVYNLEYYI